MPFHLFVRPQPWRPHQKPIELADVRGLPELSSRRYRLADDWSNYFRDPAETGRDDWGLWLPCEETYWNVASSCESGLIGPNLFDGRCGAFFQGVGPGDEDFERVKTRMGRAAKYIGIRDRMAMSFALDYTLKEGGNSDRTELCVIRDRAEPQPGVSPTEFNLRNADALVRKLEEFVNEIECYKVADVVVCVPPKNPAAIFHLPAYLARSLAVRLGISDEVDHVSSLFERQSVRVLEVEQRLSNLEGTIEVSPDRFTDKVVLVIDDLYQSGISMNYVAYLLMQQGAHSVLGLSCLKSLTNTSLMETQSNG